MASANVIILIVASISLALAVPQSPLNGFAKHGKKILGAAFNYRDTALELNVVKPDAPQLFFKPSTAYVTEGNNIVIPESLRNVSYEVELGIVIGKTCKNVAVDEAADCIGGVCLGLDLTAFHELHMARDKGYPWTISKGFDTSNPVSRFVGLNEIADIQRLDMQLFVNGERAQRGNTHDMIFDSFELISHLSKYMTLEPMDLIMTGTPKGIRQAKRGDKLVATLGEKGKEIVKMHFSVQ